MKHVNYKLYQNTKPVMFIETNFYKHNRVHFRFSLLAPKARLLSNLGGSLGRSDAGIDGTGGALSLSSSSSNTMGFSADPSIDKSSNVVGEKGVSMLGLNTAFNYEFSQLSSMSSRSDT